MKRGLSRIVDCVWILFLLGALAGGVVLFSHLSKNASRAGFIFWFE